MSGCEALLNKALELKKKGLSVREIADELNLQVDTVDWLLLHEKERARAPPPMDYAVNWSAIGCSTRRLSQIGWAMADIVRESRANNEFEDFDVVVGIELSGLPLGLMVADDLEKPFAAARAAKPTGTAEGSRYLTGTISMNFSSVEGKRVLLVTDVISTGIILRDVIRSLKELQATPVAMVAFVDKRGGGDIEGVPVKALVSLIPFKR
ncbi:MAG: orotate phosphoribosyltransferase-like protein [Candidatus Bathyarchaeia archaeon]